MCITLGLGHDAGLVCGRLFLQARSRADSTWNDIVGICLRFVLCPLSLLPSLQYIVKRCLNLFGWAHTPLLQIDANHLHAHLVAIQDCLHQRAHPWCDLIALFSQSCVHTHLSNHLAHRSLCSLHHGICWILAFKKPSPGIAQAVLDGKLDFDNVFIFGQHGRLAQPSAFDDIVPPHVSRSYLGHKNQFVTLDRIRKTPVETSPFGALVLAKLRNDCLLTFLDDENTGPHPDHKNNTGNKPNAHASALHVWLKPTSIAPAR
ncbi:MAG: hypothetical protein ACD_23C00353G0001, partial [uncultured bacterium]